MENFRRCLKEMKQAEEEGKDPSKVSERILGLRAGTVSYLNIIMMLKDDVEVNCAAPLDPNRAIPIDGEAEGERS